MKRIIIVIAISIFLPACAPEIGSEEWCEDMKEKSKGDWTMTETKDYAKHCLLK